MLITVELPKLADQNQLSTEDQHYDQYITQGDQYWLDLMRFLLGVLFAKPGRRCAAEGGGKGGEERKEYLMRGNGKVRRNTRWKEEMRDAVLTMKRGNEENEWRRNVYIKMNRKNGVRRECDTPDELVRQKRKDLK